MCLALRRDISAQHGKILDYEFNVSFRIAYRLQPSTLERVILELKRHRHIDKHFRINPCRKTA